MSVFVVLAAGVAVNAVRPSVITNPDWLSRPNGEQVEQSYPPLPLTMNIEGRVVISCDVDAGGALQGCVPVLETPEGLGFGGAAVSLSHLFHMKPKTLDGAPVGGGTVRIPIRFTIPDRSKDRDMESLAPFLPPQDPPPPSPEALAAARKFIDALGVASIDQDRYRHEADLLLSTSSVGLTLETRQKAARALLKASGDQEATRLEAAAALVAGYVPQEAMTATLEFLNSPTAVVLRDHGAAMIETIQPVAAAAMADATAMGEACGATADIECFRRKTTAWRPPGGTRAAQADAKQIALATSITAEATRAAGASLNSVMSTEFKALNPEFREIARTYGQFLIQALNEPVTRALAEELPPESLNALLAYVKGPGGQFILSPQALRFAMAVARMEGKFDDRVQADARAQFCATVSCGSPEGGTLRIPPPKP